MNSEKGQIGSLTFFCDLLVIIVTVHLVQELIEIILVFVVFL